MPLVEWLKEEDQSPTWGDYGKAVSAGVSDVGGMYHAAGRFLAERAGERDLENYHKASERLSDMDSEDTVAGMSEEGRKRIEATITSEDFWKHPISATALKTSRQTPSMAAAIVPAVLLPGVGGATIGAGVVGGSMTTAQTLDDLYKAVDDAPEEKLQTIPYYAGLRSMGMSEEDARRDYGAMIRGNKPIINFALGAVTNAFGPSAGAARAIKGGTAAVSGTGRGLAGRVGAAAGESAVSEGIEEGGQNATVQTAKIQGGLQDGFDTRQLVDSSLEGALLGGVMAAPGGVAGHGPQTAAKVAPKVVDKVEVVGPVAPNAEQTVALDAKKPAAPEVTAPPASVSEAAPVATSEQINDEPHEVPGGFDVSVPSEMIPAHVEEDAPPGAPGEVPAPVAAASKRVRARKVAAAPVEVTPEVTTPAETTEAPASETVPAPVAAASERLNATGGRILRPTDAAEAEAERVSKEAQDAAKPQLVEKVVKGKNRTKAEITEREDSATAAKTIFDEEVPADRVFPNTLSQRTELKESLTKLLKRAEDAGVKIPAKVGYEGTSDHVVYLREAKSMLAALNKKGTPPAKLTEHLTSFLGRERAAKGGDFSVMRSERAAEGDLAKRVGQGDVEMIGTAAGPDAEKDQVITAAPKSAKGPVRGVAAETEEATVKLKTGKTEKVERAVAASKGKVITPTKKVRYLHGSPTGGITRFEGRHTYLTTRDDVAHKYATTQIMGAQRDKGGQKSPTVYGVGVVGDLNTLDLRKPEHREVYEKIRKEHNDATTDPDAKLPPLKSEGFIHRQSGLPNFGRVNEILERAEKHGFDSIAVQEAVEHGEALLVRSDRTVITDSRDVTPKVKLAPKIQEVKARVEAAAKKVNTSPTEAQKESGTYAKGHVSVQGLEIAIENPRGSERTGKGKDGKTWSVKMPDHYGYIKRTEGADGDHVDVYVGPNPESKHVFLVDQQNHETQEFDEHKAMLGYDDYGSALHAYEKAFSDGKGLDRIKKLTPMSMDDFKGWLHRGDTTKPAPSEDVVQSAARSATVDDMLDLLRRPRRTMPKPDEGVVVGMDGREVPALYTQTVGEALRTIKSDHLQGVAAKMFPLIRSRLLELVPDVKMSFVSAEGMQELVAASGSLSSSTAGYHELQRSTGKDFIVFDLSKIQTPAEATHVVVHETVHAATMHALIEDERTGGPARRYIREIMSEAADVNPLLLQEYGFTNTAEFIAEAMSNSQFQADLASIPISESLATRLRLVEWKARTLWYAVVDSIRQLLGLPPNYHTALEAILRVSEHLMTKNVEVRKNGITPADTSTRSAIQSGLSFQAADIKEAFTRAAQQEQQGSPKLLKLMTFGQMAQVAERYFGGNPVKRLYDLREQRRVRASKILQESEPLAQRHVELERKYKGAQWDRFADLIHDETYAGVFADKDLASQTHLGKDTLDGAWSKAQHPDIHARWSALPEDLKGLRRDVMKFYTDQQNQMSLDIVKNRVLAALGISDDALAKRIFEETHTPADVTTVGGEHMMDLILDAKALSKINGPYYPLMRHGDYVVQGFYKIAPPTTGKLVAGTDNVFEFKDRKEALDYAKAQDTRPVVKSVYVHSVTGKTYGVEADGTEVKMTSKDPDAEQRFHVHVQDKHVEFFDTEREAREAAHELEGSPAFRLVKGVENKRFEPGDMRADMVSSEVRRLKEGLEKRSSYHEFTPSQKNELTQALNEASIRMLGSTRIQSKRLPRKYVAGASKDMTRVMWDYAQSTSGYLAKLEYAPKIEAVRKEIRAAVGDDATKSNSLGRSAIANEIDRRELKDDAHQTGKINKAAQRLMTVSFVDKLASPATSVVNLMQAAVVGMPVIAGRHGVARTVTEMGKAYSDISGFSIIKQSLGEFGRKVAGKDESANYLTDIKRRLKDAGERKLFDTLEERGTIDADAGLELGELSRTRGGNTLSSRALAQGDRALGYLEGIVRQVPKAVEAINRSVVALTAYRLELKRSGSHDKAVEYAQRAVDNSQFNYSNTNAAPIFNHPLAKLSFQFKKYGAAMYFLIGHNIGQAYRNTAPGDRAEALKTLGLIAVTHMAVAGALGLPTEPFKYLLMGAKAAGLTATGWDDVEEIIRAHAADILGKSGGEIFAKGLPRALGIDVSSRMGLDSLMTFGEPKSDKEADVKKWLFDTLAGAPASLVGDYIKGANKLTDGEFTKAAELMVPIKFASDAIRAYRTATEGKKASTGRALSEPYTPVEAGLRAFGFTPEREAEEGAKSAAFRNQTTKAKDARQAVIDTWINAKGPDKVKAQRAVQAYNRTAERDMRIATKDLTSAGKRRESQGTGITTTKRTQATLDRLEQVYQ